VILLPLIDMCIYRLDPRLRRLLIPGKIAAVEALGLEVLRVSEQAWSSGRLFLARTNTYMQLRSMTVRLGWHTHAWLRKVPGSPRALPGSPRVSPELSQGSP
jgi:hypothetical protein